MGKTSYERFDWGVDVIEGERGREGRGELWMKEEGK